MDLENNTLREISQTENVESHMISLMWDINLNATNDQTRKTKLADTDGSMVVTRGKGPRGSDG